MESRWFIPGISRSDQPIDGYASETEMRTAASAMGVNVDRILAEARFAASNPIPVLSSGSRYSRTGYAYPSSAETDAWNLALSEHLESLNLNVPAFVPVNMVPEISDGVETGESQLVEPQQNPQPLVSTQIHPQTVSKPQLQASFQESFAMPSQQSNLTGPVYEGGTMEPFVVTPEKSILPLLVIGGIIFFLRK